MSSLQQNASFLTFSGELTSAGAVRLLSVMLQAPGYRLTLKANGGGDWLREDLAELGEELLRAASHPQVTLRLTRGGGSAIGGQTQPRGRASGFGRCCSTIAQPFGLSARDGRSGGAPTWCSGL